MGTNYYLKIDPCPHCGRCDEEWHIGKSSGGWCFTLHVIPERNINTLDDWRREWSQPNRAIKGESGEAVTIAEMERIITKRSWPHSRDTKPLGYESREQFHAMNHSTNGPSGLLRHALGPHCVGHGEGTWDYCPGEFS